MYGYLWFLYACNTDRCDPSGPILEEKKQED